MLELFERVEYDFSFTECMSSQRISNVELGVSQFTTQLNHLLN